MQIIKSPKRIRTIITQQKQKGKTIGFVPTMGMLHKGHLSLIRAAKKNTDFVVVSIFINPLQFGPKEDFKQYPRNIKKDKSLLKQERVDLIFYPNAKDIYKNNFSTYVEETSLTQNLCGRSRTGHFKGVTTVVCKLFNIVQPDAAYFGQKDYQQAMVIKKMTEDLNLPVNIKTCPIIREKSGLALSSRNFYLNIHERKDAGILYQSLKLAKKSLKQNKNSVLKTKNIIRTLIKTKVPKAKIDYIEILDKDNLQSVNRFNKDVLIALAVRISGVRLIDNIIVKRFGLL
ncbi:pantoate--beta-alanine ligase [bacterium]